MTQQSADHRTTGTILDDDQQPTTTVISSVSLNPTVTGQAYTVNVSVTAPDPQILIANPGTPTTARDTGITGIGQMVVDSGGGFIGLDHDHGKLVAFQAGRDIGFAHHILDAARRAVHVDGDRS